MTKELYKLYKENGELVMYVRSKQEADCLNLQSILSDILRDRLDREILNEQRTHRNR